MNQQRSFTRTKRPSSKHGVSSKDIAELKALIAKGERVYRRARNFLDKLQTKQMLEKIHDFSE